MSAKIEGIKMMRQKELKESSSDSFYSELPEQTETEIKWVKLHQMFDR